MTKEIPSRIVPVSVTVSAGEDKDTVTITCNPEPVPIGACDTLLSFKLETPGYRFKHKNAIVIETPDPDFPYDSWTISETHATLLDLCNTHQDFKYSVYIVRTSDGKEFNVDPVIANGNTSGD